MDNEHETSAHIPMGFVTKRMIIIWQVQPMYCFFLQMMCICVFLCRSCA